MASYNKVIMVGNLTRDPDLKFLPSQTPIVEFGIAVNDKYKTKDGLQKEDVCFMECKAFGKPAETLNQYLTKGSCILLEGKLKFESWESKSGEKRSKHVLKIEGFQFMGGSKGSGGSGTPSAPYVAPVPEQDIPF